MFYTYRVMRIEDVLRSLEGQLSSPLPGPEPADRFDGIGPAALGPAPGREVGTSTDLEELQADGYRWVRTDGGLAIFERACKKAPARTKPELIVERVQQLIGQGYSKIVCIKEHRRLSSTGLKESKNAVEIIASEAGLSFGSRSPLEEHEDGPFSLGDVESTEPSALVDFIMGGE